jgi:hypothetical protein
MLNKVINRACDSYCFSFSADSFGLLGVPLSSSFRYFFVPVCLITACQCVSLFQFCLLTSPRPPVHTFASDGICNKQAPNCFLTHTLMDRLPGAPDGIHRFLWETLFVNSCCEFVLFVVMMTAEAEACRYVISL